MAERSADEAPDPRLYRHGHIRSTPEFSYTVTEHDPEARGLVIGPRASHRHAR
jgi:hypothetical protein